MEQVHLIKFVLGQHLCVLPFKSHIFCLGFTFGIAIVPCRKGEMFGNACPKISPWKGEMLGNQLCSLHKLQQCSINLDFGLLAFSRCQISFKDVACILCSCLSSFFSTSTEKWPNGMMLGACSIISVCIKYNLEVLT